MRKKPAIIVKNNDDNQLLSPITANDVDSLVKNVKYPIVFNKKGKISSDSSIDDLENLSDSDESSVKVTKSKKNVTKQSVSKSSKIFLNKTKNDDEPVSKKFKGKQILDDDDMSVTEVILTTRVPRKTSSCENSVASIDNQASINKNIKVSVNHNAVTSVSEQSSTTSETDKIKVVNKHNMKDENGIMIDVGIVTCDNVNISDDLGINGNDIIVPSRASISNNITSPKTQNLPEATCDNVNILDDLGINDNDIIVPSRTSISNNITSPKTQKLPEALLRCAYIQNENSQTVVFWCEELTRWAFKCQNKIMLDIREGKHWVTREVPFAAQFVEPSISLYLYRNNIYIKGLHGTFGIRLFHYTLKTRFQTETNIINTAQRIVKYVNEDCKAKLIFDANRLFLYKKPCVWSNLIGKKGALEKLVRDSNEVLNDQYSSNPGFWDNNFNLIKKFFFVNKLQVDVAELLNAPLENIDPCIERTADLIRLVGIRRNATPINRNNEVVIYDEIDPEDEVFTNNVENNNTTLTSNSNIDTLDNNNTVEINVDPSS